MLPGTLLTLSVLGALMVRNVPGLALCVALLTQRFRSGSVYWPRKNRCMPSASC